MKKLIFILLFLISLTANAQLRYELSVQGRGSNVNGTVGVELQIKQFGISEGWRPLTTNNNSFTTTLTYYLPERPIPDASFYFSLGYATKGYAYVDNELYYLYHVYQINDIKFKPCGIFFIGAKNSITPNLTTRGGFGLTYGDFGVRFAYELSVNFIIIRNHRLRVPNPLNF